MEENAYRQASTANARAARALRRLKSAETLEDAEEAWDFFLHSANRVYAKLRAGALGHGRSWTWFRKKLDERGTDELLVYMHHARNCDQHRIEEITRREPANRQLLRGTGPQGPIVIVSDVGHNLVLLPVIDRGVEYPVPRETRLGTIADTYATTAGSVMLIAVMQPLRS